LRRVLLLRRARGYLSFAESAQALTQLLENVVVYNSDKSGQWANPLLKTMAEAILPELQAEVFEGRGSC
jgi:hypothetical protein